MAARFGVHAHDLHWDALDLHGHDHSGASGRTLVPSWSEPICGTVRGAKGSTSGTSGKVSFENAVAV